MSDSVTAAGLLLKLYELRTEPTLRQARAWFAFEFHPSSSRDVLSTWLGPGHESAPYRMVTSYWDMAVVRDTGRHPRRDVQRGEHRALRALREAPALLD